MGNLNKNNRIFYFDALRALAIISVILIHISNATFFAVKLDFSIIPSFNWIIECFLQSSFRIGVCLFLMLSGALSLGRVWDIRSFLAKRIPRIVAPFLFWGFILSVLMVGISFYFPSFLTTLDSFDLGSFFKYLLNSYFNKNKGFTPYWFFWMILGTYFIMPIYNKWLLHADLKEAEYFIIIWLITCIFDFTLFLKFPIKLTYFSGPIGVVVLGYYLRHTQRNLLNNPYFSVFLIIIGFLGSFISIYLKSSLTNFAIIDRYSIFNIMLVTGIFLLFKNFSKFDLKLNVGHDGIFRKMVFSLAKYSYGIYLIHRVVIVLLFNLLIPYLHFKLLLISLIVGTIVISWLIMDIFNRIPYINQIIGSK